MFYTKLSLQFPPVIAAENDRNLSVPRWIAWESHLNKVGALLDGEGKNVLVFLRASLGWFLCACREVSIPEKGVSFLFPMTSQDGAYTLHISTYRLSSPPAWCLLAPLPYLIKVQSKLIRDLVFCSCIRVKQKKLLGISDQEADLCYNYVITGTTV